MTGATPAAWNDPVKGGELAQSQSWSRIPVNTSIPMDYGPADYGCDPSLSHR